MTPAERKAAAADRKLAREEKRQAWHVEQARRALVRAKVDRVVKARVKAGATDEEIARHLAEVGDALLTWAWVPVPGVPAVLERYDGPTLYAAALLIVRAVRANL